MIKFIGSLFLILISTFSYGYINISPTSLDKNIGEGAYEEFTLYNNTKFPIRYKVTAFEMKEGVVKDMSKWMEIYPKVLTVEPLGEKSFKLYIKSPQNAANGDYGAFLNIRQVSVPKLKSDDKTNISSGLTVMTNLNMGLYGYVGNETPDIEIENLKIVTRENKNYLSLDLENRTDRLVRLQVEVEDEKKGIYPVGEFRVLKEQTALIDHEIKNLSNKSMGKKVLIKNKEDGKVLKIFTIN